MAAHSLRLVTECPGCGLKRREGWTRCPRCRTLLFAEASADDQARSALAARLGTWAAGGAAAMVALLVAVGVIRSVTTSPPAPAATRAPADRPVSQPTARGATTRPVDQATRTAQLAFDDVRAGNAAYVQGDLEAALDAFEAAVAANPSDPDARNNLAQVLVRLNRADEALPHFAAAIAADPERWSFRFNRARAYDQLERWTEAIADYRESGRLFPEDYATQFNLGLSLMKVKRYQEAVLALERAVQLAPSEPSFLITLGTAYVGAEQPARARAVFQQFLELAPDDAEAPRVRALIAAFDASAS
ncbi:MAG: tetratricopeptide repeat protein [Acidobacteriota bacterium]